MMTTKNIFLTMLAVVIAGAVGLVACTKNLKETINDRPLFASGGIIPGVCGGSPGAAGRDTLSGVLGTGHAVRDTIRLFSDKLHCLRGLVYVDELDVLEIEAGTIIVGLDSTTILSGSIPKGGLIITRGAKIEAEGNPTCPIVFTSQYTVDAGTPRSGDWAGVILLGRAPVNQTNPQVEGVPSVTAGDTHYGGTVCDDNSGTLKYVRIEYAGTSFSLNNEINGLTLGGVGCGTTIDYVEVYKANDDAFEFFGGTVNCTHLIAVDPLDDIYDFDFGYTGHIQFALGLADQVRADQSISNGIEADNNNTSGFLGSPETRPVISNMTLIGYDNADTALAPRRGVGNQWRRNAGFMLESSIVLGFKTGLLLDGCQSETKYLGSAPVDSLKSNLVHSYNTGAQFLTTGACFGSIAAPGNIAYSSVFSIGLLAPFSRSTVGFYQPVSAPALTGFVNAGLSTTPNCCGFSFTTDREFRGAFGPEEDDDWAFGWARF